MSKPVKFRAASARGRAEIHGGKVVYQNTAFQARNSEFAVGSAEKMLDDMTAFLQNIKETDERS